MALEIYSDDARTVQLKRENIFTATVTNHVLDGLVQADIQKVFKYNGVAYVVLASPTDYSIVGPELVLTTALVEGEHIVVMPNANLNLTFTGAAGSSRTQTRKLVFHKGDTTTIYDALNLYSENLTLPQIDMTETVYGGLYSFTVDESFACWNSLGPVVGVGFNITTDMSAFDLEKCAVLVNGQYVGDILYYDAISMIVLATGTVLPVNNTEDVIQIISTGDLRFALGSVGDVLPLDGAFKRVVTIPTLTVSAPTQYVWLRETAIIPTDTVESPNMPFKLIGQTYPQ